VYESSLLVYVKREREREKEREREIVYDKTSSFVYNQLIKIIYALYAYPKFILCI